MFKVNSVPVHCSCNFWKHTELMFRHNGVTWCFPFSYPWFHIPPGISVTYCSLLFPHTLYYVMLRHTVLHYDMFRCLVSGHVISDTALLCVFVFCCVMSCRAILCYFAFCRVVLWCAMVLCYLMLSIVVAQCVMCCCVVLYRALMCYDVLCCVMLCRVLMCHDVLC